MSELYTTGEIAKLCMVSVRTVQYYDTRGILIPSNLSEGGRRLYSADDLKRMQIICFLRDMGLSINSISRLFEDEDPRSVIEIIISQQKQQLRSEIDEKKTQLESVERLGNLLGNVEDFSLESICDIAYVMNVRKKMYHVRATMMTLGLICEIIELATLILWIVRGIWWPYVAGLPFIIGISVWLVVFYFKKVDYICPKCHNIFKPKFVEMLFASHTPTTRKLTCTCCGKKGFCIETYGKETEK